MIKSTSKIGGVSLIYLLLCLILPLCVANVVMADIYLSGYQSLGDNSKQPIDYDDFANYPVYFYLSQPVTLTKLQLQGVSGQEGDSQIKVVIDGDQVAEGVAGQDHISIANLDLGVGLHSLSIRGDCYLPNGNVAPNCNGNLDQDDFSYTGITLKSTAGVTAAIHLIQKYHLGDNNDSNDGYDPTDSNYPYYPDARDATEVTFEFTLPTAINHIDVDFYRLRALDYINKVYIDDDEVGTLISGGDSVNLTTDPYTISVDDNLTAGTHTLKIVSGSPDSDFDDFSWDEIIIRPVNLSPPLAEYRFDECTLADGVIDSSGNGHNGTVQGDAENSLAAGSLCRGAEFDGVDDYIEVPSSNSLSSSTAMSFCAWVNTRVNDTKKIVHRGNWQAHQGLAQDKWNGWFVEFTINESNESLKWNEGSGSNRVPNQNQWYYLVGTYDGNDIKLYVDGQLEKSEHVPGTLSVKDTPLWIGSEGTKKIFDGFIDEVMVFDRALTATQVDKMYHNYMAGDSWDGESRDCLPCQGFCFKDKFERQSLGSNWTVIESVNFTPQISGNKLMLTSNQQWVASGITLNGEFPARDNYIEIEFEHNAYGEPSGGDGMVVVLSDAEVPPKVGAFGGSLGYADRYTGTPGFKGAWLGFAIDEFGNFSKNSEGRYGGIGRINDSVSVRGHGDGYDDYRYLTGTPAPLNPGVDDRHSLTSAPSYLYRFSIDTRNGQGRIKAERDINDGNGYSDLFDWYSLNQEQVDHIPEKFQLSLTAGTGSAKNYHSIDNLTINAINCGTIGDDGPDHFEFIHDGHGLTCAAETVTLKAWLDAAETSPYVGDMEVTLPDLGWLTDTVQTLTFPVTGVGVQLKLQHTKAETVTLDVVSGDPATSPPVYCSGGNPNACDLIFADSGFLIAVANGRSCADLNGTIQAVQKDEETSFCVGDESFVGTERDIGFWFNYSAPDSGGKNLYVNSAELGQSETASTANLTFDENAAADFALNYADAGSLNLHARFEGSGVEAGLEMTGSTTQPFIVAPAYFVVTSPLNNITSGGSTTGVAAAPFSATITAVCYGGTVTPNFAADTFLTAEEPHQPSSGVLSGLGNGLLDLNTFSDGVSTPNNLTYSEVGNFTLQAESKEYLGSDMDISGSLVVGRFIPDHFELTQGTLINRIDSGCLPDSSFTYLDENLEFTYQLEAQNSAGAATKNYIANFAKFDGSGTQLSPVIYIGGAVAKDPDGISTNLTSRLDYHSAGQDSPWSDGAGSFRVKLNVNRLANPDGYFDDARFGVYVKDEDGVQIANPDLDVNGDGTMDYTQAALATTLGYGRLHLQNAHGSELLDLTVPMQAEYWNGDAFVINPFDNCTLFAQTDLSLASAKGNGSGNAPIEVNNGKTTTATINIQPLLLGDGTLELSAPGSGGEGWVDIELTVPDYLKYDWHGTGDDNPTARATFGIYKGSENIIYIRETTWR
ncbi:MAG: hypothetical protein JRG71_07425 [Deltaproteobacteria bacterium]|nr:hypothetical protein [Deltaproteobacteria bacterium]